MRILNLYAGLGGNRKLWGPEHHITAVEYTPKIAETYAGLYPNDTVIVADAHEYLLHNYQDYDFIWSSPPCQSHSRMIRGGKNRKPRYADCRLYEEILLLQHNYNGHWVVENVQSYYVPLIKGQKVGRHLLWSDLDLESVVETPQPKGFIMGTNVAASERLKEWLGIHYEGNIYYEGNHCPAQVLRNCVHPLVGQQILNLIEGNL